MTDANKGSSGPTVGPRDEEPPFKFTSCGIPEVTMTITEEEQEALFAAMNPILDDGRAFPRRGGLASFRERLGLTRHRACRAWQCSGCRFVFPTPWKKTCPCCGLVDFWSGSVDPMAPAWDGVVRTRR